MADEVKRVQYFDHQFLRVDEFTDEQDYHRRLRQVHNATLHTPGISSGLEVTVVQGASHVRVSPGTAVDANGRDIVLHEEFQLELGGLPANQAAFVVISWQERSTDPATDGSGHDTRWSEAPKVEGMTSDPADGLHLVLARVQRQGTIVQPNPDLSGRRVAGVTAGDLALSTLRLRVVNAVVTSWPTFTAPAAQSARLEGALTVTGALQTGAVTAPSAQIGGPLAVAGALAIDTANANTGTTAGGLSFGASSGEVIASSRPANAPNRFGLDFYTNSQPRLSIDNAGRVGVGVRAPQVKLDVQGGDIRWGNNSRLVNDQGGSIELGGYQGAPGTGVPYIDFHFTGLDQDFNARIQNDANGRLSLIAGTTRVTGALQVGGAVQVGSGLDVNGVLQVGADVGTVNRPASFGGHEVHSGGGGAGFSFANRNNGGPFVDSPGTTGNRWVMYAFDGIARFWSGRDCMMISNANGAIGTVGYHPHTGIPSGWGGGLHTFDVYAEATIAAGPSGGPPKAWINSSGQVAGVTKPFIIDHPDDPKRDLVHATLEGPELAVIYRGEGELSDGVATVELPSYFEGLTRVEGRTVLVTPRVAPGGRVASLGASEVRQGTFTVRAADDADASARFWWQVIAVRGDVDVLEDEPLKQGARLAAFEEAQPTKRARRAPKKKAAAKRKAAPAKR
jgi:hypothetical protein